MPRPSAKRTATSYAAAGSPLIAAARRPSLPSAAGSLSSAVAHADDWAGRAGGSAGWLAPARLGGRTLPVSVDPAGAPAGLAGAWLVARGAGSAGSARP